MIDPLHPLRAARGRRNLTQRRLAEETGVGVQTILRAEHNKPINAESRRLLCAYFNMTPEELGLVVDEKCLKEQQEMSQEEALSSEPSLSEHLPPTEQAASPSPVQASAQSALLATQEAENPDLDKSQRNFMQMLNISGAALATPAQDLLHIPLWERLSKALTTPASIDEVTFSQLETTTHECWQLFSQTVGVFSHGLLNYVLERLLIVTCLLENSFPMPVRIRLASISSELAQIAGEIYFDRKDSEKAEQYYNTAIDAAKIAKNDVLRAVALGRKCFIPIYTQDARRALPFLEEAQKLSRGAPDVIRAWLCAVEAEVRGNLRDEKQCLKALDRSEFYVSLTTRGESGEIPHVRFNQASLMGYRGICFIRLQLPEQAQKILHQTVTKLEEDPKRLRHKAIVLIDLATTYIQQRELEEACRYATQALVIIAQIKSVRVFQRLMDLRRKLEPWSATITVRHLDEQIHTLVPYIALQGDLT